MPKTKTTKVNPARLSPGTLLIVGLAATGVALMLIPRSNNAQNLPANARSNNAATTSSSSGSASVTKDDAKTLAVYTPTEAPTRHSVEFYTGEVRESLFAAPQPPAPKPAPPAPKPQPAPQPAPVVVDPFASWVYNGTIKLGDTTMALLENSSTKDGKYLKVGDDFIGAKVESIDDRSITLNLAGIPRFLSKSETVNITPLDKSAAFLQPGAQNQPGQPGQPGQGGMDMMGMGRGGMMANWGGGWGGDPNATYTLPNGTVLTGAAAQGYQRRLNRGYNGGGGGGGNRFRGGGGGGGRRGGAMGGNGG